MCQYLLADSIDRILRKGHEEADQNFIYLVTSYFIVYSRIKGGGMGKKWGEKEDFLLLRKFV